MKPIGEAITKAARHRRFHWCRRQNGFSDRPLWRVVAAQLELPLFQVLAFVNRLEEFANAAEQRGHVGEFNAAEFGAALGMGAADAARIFAELERPEVGWIAYDHVADFFARNPDREDDAEAARERKRRQRSREKGMKEIARRFARGEIDDAQRRIAETELLVDARLSTGHGGHNVTPRDIVTVTPEQSRVLTLAENSAAAVRGETGGNAREGAAEIEIATAWLDAEGKQAIVERMQVTPLQAETQLARWRRDLRDEVALANIIRGVTLLDRRGSSFQIFISDQVQRALRTGQRSLPLGPTPVTAKRGLA
jgi:hypothetical protein